MTVVADAVGEGGARGAPPDSGAAAPPGRSRSRERLLDFTERYALVVLFVAMLIFFSVWSKTSNTFPHATNIKNVLGGEAYSGILALAIMIPLVCGEFDFSVGNSAGLTQVLCAGFMARLGMAVPLAILIPIAIGAFIGLSNGNTVARIGVNSLIVTLGVSSVLLGIVQWYTNGQSISNNISPWLSNISNDEWFGLPVTLYILAVAALVVYYMLEHTPYGRYLYSIGSNRDAARLVGLRVERYVLTAFILSGTLAGVAGILLVANSGGGNPQAGQIIDTLQALAAAYLGATAIKPGRFNVLGTIIAIYFLAFTVTGLTLAGVADWINSVFDGGALFVAVLVSTIIGRRRAGTS
ncbi:MAG: ABC transporter permease [Acidimicrobiales bacterium]